ncbi:MAG: FecR domain-containing protein [Verrucomicrobia bacterium]|nr:FecR domain-containing protein [Verrucomicrobiota bacterium]
MKTSATLTAIALGCGCLAGVAQAKPLGQATVTETNNDVRYQAANSTERPAKLKDVVRGADMLRTGQKSQAEIEFEDSTITRLGSNSLFTFDPGKREFELREGVLLFDMQKGIGGGNIRTGGITAAIEGTAGMVIRRGPPQVICLAGLIRILDAQGKLLGLLRPGDTFFGGRVLQISLRELSRGKLLQRGLRHNQAEFDAVIRRQEADIQSGKFLQGIEDEPQRPSASPPPPAQQFKSGIEQLRQNNTPPPRHPSPPTGNFRSISITP